MVISRRVPDVGPVVVHVKEVAPPVPLFNVVPSELVTCQLAMSV